MAFDSLLRWIDLTDLDNLDHATALEMLKSTLKELEDQYTPDAQRAVKEITPVYLDFLHGGLSTAKLRELYQRNLHRLQSDPGVPPGVALEERLRKMADDLSEDEWCTNAYLNLEEAVEDFLDGDPAPLEKVIRDMEATLQRAWEPYQASSVLDSEIKAESVVGHRLLKEGVREWYAALDAARLAARGKEDWEEALAIAEYANRLLVAVEKFSASL